MLELKKEKINTHAGHHMVCLSSQSGFTLLEMLISSVILITAASMTLLLINQPRDRMNKIEQKIMVNDYLKSQFLAIKEAAQGGVQFSAFQSNLCSNQALCRPDVCGNQICPDGTAGSGSAANGWAARCQGSGFQESPYTEGDPLDQQSPINQVLLQYPGMCYLHIVVNPNCDPSLVDNVRASQVCVRAEWAQKSGGGVYEQALTTFVFRA